MKSSCNCFCWQVLNLTNMTIKMVSTLYMDLMQSLRTMDLWEKLPLKLTIIAKSFWNSSLLDILEVASLLEHF